MYTPGVSLDNRINYHPRNIKKSLDQSNLIRKCFFECIRTCLSVRKYVSMKGNAGAYFLTFFNKDSTVLNMILSNFINMSLCHTISFDIM